MLLGREFGLEDNNKAPKVAVISEMLAHQCFGNANPIGRRIADHDNGEFQVVGVVNGSRYGGVKELPRSVLYLPFFQDNLAEASFAETFEIRYSGSLSTVLDGVRRRVWAIDRNFPLFRVKTLEVQTEDSLVKERLITTLSAFFGVLAALLACIGLYGRCLALVSQPALWSQTYGCAHTLGCESPPGHGCHVCRLRAGEASIESRSHGGLAL